MTDQISVKTVEFTTRPCIVCRTASVFNLELSAFVAWKGGTLIQAAFPTMSIDDRETLISGTHAGCWDRMFGEECE